MSSIDTNDTKPASVTALAPWLFVGIPFVWGVFITIGNASALIR